ncbi:FAD dependent oxidoreductase [Catenulispora acidiphila DSM 44928]|uniref:FAD dependent oxidoreductase n=1 Tax=Catenulispora acidiphila (strain DSM 44928 / JCM 14897 / NBRC 102108 / NRRL B-24433 / ID139908) TaxID=479433 RepID=C7Q5F0_CATAD|nr:FAD-binding oxidoreductase [Catenulispora acidiphila]ACU75919.1 FAD dependent oxidoreductase [Catenulispora acidiphila DSM 44928]
MKYHHLLADASPTPYWLDTRDRPGALDALAGRATADLVVVGGGYSGLWTALLAKERDPGRDVVLLEANRIGWAASGRNGGFCSASLTHGADNGESRWPEEMDTLERLGRENLDQIEATLERYGIDCDFRRSGELAVATAEWQAEELASADTSEDVVFLDRAAVREQLASPTYHAGLWDKTGCAMVDPARLAFGLREACLRLGVRIYERSPVSVLERDDLLMRVATDRGEVLAPKVALATNAFPSLLRRVRSFIVPVYDYALMTEPLSEPQMKAIGWENRQGVGDSANHFHYYRLSADNRILWGGYDAVYHFGSKISSRLDQRPETFDKLAGHFFETFPQLEGLKFGHKWGGVIDTCSRFCAFFGTAHGGAVAYAAGYTGLGVGATRFGADVMLDLLSGEATERTELKMVRSKPVPFPPEPARWFGITVTSNALARADGNGGRRNLWLRTLDRFGMGFDS